jgi:hypothetical protein
MDFSIGYYPSGDIRMISTYRDGSKHGVQRIYYEDTRDMALSRYQDGSFRYSVSFDADGLVDNVEFGRAAASDSISLQYPSPDDVEAMRERVGDPAADEALMWMARARAPGAPGSSREAGAPPR